MCYFLGFRDPAHQATGRVKAKLFTYWTTMSVSLGLWLACAISAHAAIIPTGDVTPTYNGTDDPWNVLSIFVVGDTATGTLTINAGSDVISLESQIGSLAGSDGTVTVTDPGSTWTVNGKLYIGIAGTGTLLVENGGEVITDRDISINGMTTVTGAGSALSSDGVPQVNDTLNVLAGADLTAAGMQIGQDASATGVVNVDGPGSALHHDLPAGGGILMVGVQGRGTLNVTNGGAVDIVGIGSGSMEIGFFAGSVGVATVNGSDSTIMIDNGGINVGRHGDGTLNIQNGGVVSSTDSFVGENSGSSGIVTVTGVGSLWDNTGSLIVGEGGAGTLNVVSGGVVNSTFVSLGEVASSTGAATISGPGSAWNNSNGLMDVGHGGTGTLTIDNGGAVNNRTTWISTLPGSIGTVAVDGAGSILSSTNDLVISQHGTGTLNIINGGTVDVSVDTWIGLYSSGSGTINFNNGTLNTGGLLATPSELLGTGTINAATLVTDTDLVFDTTTGLQQTIAINALPGQNITVNLDASDPANPGALGAGYRGTGTLTINDGLSVASASGFLGYHAGSDGAVTVNGTGSTWNNASHMYIGYSGNGTLNIDNAGTVDVGGFLFLGHKPGADGTVNLSGGTLDMNGGEMIKGAGTATFNFTGGTLKNPALINLDQPINQTGGTLIFDGSVPLATILASHYTATNATIDVSGSAVVTMGNLLEVDGTATIDGLGSAWNSGSNIQVGVSGTGTLDILNGGTATSFGAIIGHNVGSNGTVTIDGPGSNWTNTGGALYVGALGSGTLNIMSGGLATNGRGIIGREVGSSGVVSVTGTGSLWENTESLFIGSDGAASGGTGTLNINPGGLVTIAALTRVSSQTSVINLAGGTLQTGQLILEGDSAKLNWTSGEIHLTDQDLRVDTGFDFGNQLTVPAGGTLTVDGAGIQSVGNQGAGTLIIDGGTVELTAADGLVIGRFTGGNGTLTIQNGGHLSVNGKTEISKLAVTSGEFNISGSSTADFGLDGQATSDLQIGVKTTGTFNQTGGTVTLHGGPIILGSDAGGDGTYAFSEGIINANGGLTVGANGTGTFNQTGGILNVAGTQTVGFNTVTPTATFVLTTGTNTVTGALQIGTNSPASGRYIINSGLLDINTAETATGGEALVLGKDGTGSLNHNGGIVRINHGDLILAPNATGRGFYHLDGGTLDMQNNDILRGLNSDYQFNFNGGTILNPGTIDLQVATFVQRGGTVVRDAPGTTHIPAIYQIKQGGLEISDGTVMTDSSQFVGVDAGVTTTVTHAGGDNLVGFVLNIGAGAGVIGEYNLSGDGLLVATNAGPSGSGDAIRVGNSNGQGTFNQTGGAVQTPNGHLILANDGATGTYNLSAGTLDLMGHDLNGGSGTAVFNFTGGTLQGVNIIDLGFAFEQAGGTLAPGGSIGQTTIVSGYNLNAGTLEIELGGIGDPIDLLTIIGDAHIATLGTTLDLSALGGIAAGTYTILQASAGTVTGYFENVVGLELFGLTPTIQNTGTAITLTLADDLIFSDPNLDGFVGIEDLNIVLSNWNQSVTAGDALSGDLNGDGFVGIDDLNAILGSWNLGTPPPAATILTIPEPTSLGLLMVGMLWGSRRRRLHQSAA